ncbi:2-succinyl-6-hydroxy-2,4-cyclohexadiene-1-carboxylate synthase [Paenibacillus anaericanus]|uniref:alpha/beta fold hydrolase n=1 Tax=Paenibacillus anaericanus TaxID=170367 RepID=UPI002787E78A|nr:alpha/beta hydrolase [Paenibacillus anaericanus]MDQ0089006.1 2-succinyl-6-hydroxy-2,4-cyclohexadiene-1-carboxylate synthase [Paenibacillus anaericanus]
MKEEIIKLDHIGINVMYSLDYKEVVLFLHFSGGNLNMWEGIIPQFADKYSVIAPDFRGHGKSDKPLIGYHIDDMANDIYILLKRLNVDHCHIVGSSMGAEIGLSLAASHPELVKSLICEGALCNEFGEHGLFNGTEEEIEQNKEVQRAQLAERIERVFTTKDEYIEEEREEFVQEGLWNEYFLAFFENNLQQMKDGNFTYCYLNHVRTEYIQKYWDVKFEQYYEKVQCPVLFLPGEEEWENEKIRKSLHTFASLLDIYEIKRIEKSIHAYVWMQLPIAAGEVAKRFISKHAE